MVPVPVLTLSFYRYDFKSICMALPGDELTVKLRRISMRDGNTIYIVVNIETFNTRGEKGNNLNPGRHVISVFLKC